MHNVNKYLGLLSVASLLAGCATEQPNVQLTDSFWKNKQQSIAVADVKANPPKAYRTGGQGLLDIAINEAASNSINTALKETSVAWYYAMPKTIAADLNQRKIVAKALPEPLDPKQTDNYAAIAAQANTNEVLVIKLDAVGTTRRYYGFVPLGAPQAYCALSGELINTETNKVLWRYTTQNTQPIATPWDQAPNFPNVKNAMQVAVNHAKEEMIDSLLSGH